MKYVGAMLLAWISCTSSAQSPDSIYYPTIKTAQLFSYGNQLQYPTLRLNSNDRLELHFDDLDGNVKNYYYTYQLCNADWSPSNLTPFDFIRGFSQVQISAYQNSSIALTKYTHYQAIVPDVNSAPTRSGNYILKVYLDGDTSNLAFTRRFLVTEDAVTIAAQVLQPFNPQIALTHQKIQFTVNTRSLDLTNPMQQITVVLLQNHRWDNALVNVRPSFFSGNTFEYNSDDDCVFPGGNQWRFADLQSFHFLSDRIQRAENNRNEVHIFLKPDADRSRHGYIFYNDIDGLYYTQTTESVNPLWQTDYAMTHFSFIPAARMAFSDKDVYLLGKLTDYDLIDTIRMNFNEQRGMYETSVLLKQGYYNYAYVTVDRADTARKPTFAYTEGNFQETENDYTILIYYRPLGGRADQLVGMAKLNSLNAKSNY
jgi:Domain of unknown function (DUF5103)